MKIYLDDLRMPYDDSWVLVHNAQEFKTLVTSNSEPITEISFDHDLGKDEPSGYTVAKWFVEYVMNHHELAKNLEQIIVHSDNTPGRENIAGYFESARAHDIFNDSLAVIRSPAMLRHPAK